MPIHLDLLEEVIMEKVELWLAEMHCGGLLTFQCVAPSLLPLQFYSSLPLLAIRGPSSRRRRLRLALCTKSNPIPFVSGRVIKRRFRARSRRLEGGSIHLTDENNGKARGPSIRNGMARRGGAKVSFERAKPFESRSHSLFGPPEGFFTTTPLPT